MLRPVRLVVLAALALLVYMGFFAVPGGNRSELAFDPELVATHEVAIWQAAQAHDEFAAYVNVALMQRELHRYSWFRATQASYYLARATTQFVNMTNRFERVMPDLEAAAAIEKSWKNADFDPQAAARAQLTWWVTNKMPDLGTTDDVASLMADEYAIRYNMRMGNFLAATRYRAEAGKLRDQAKVDPDWDGIRNMLVESYRAMHLALEQGRTRRAADR
jgi:hypothetical protein